MWVETVGKCFDSCKVALRKLHRVLILHQQVRMGLGHATLFLMIRNCIGGVTHKIRASMRKNRGTATFLSKQFWNEDGCSVSNQYFKFLRRRETIYSNLAKIFIDCNNAAGTSVQYSVLGVHQCKKCKMSEMSKKQNAHWLSHRTYYSYDWQMSRAVKVEKSRRGK